MAQQPFYFTTNGTGLNGQVYEDGVITATIRPPTGGFVRLTIHADGAVDADTSPKEDWPEPRQITADQKAQLQKIATAVRRLKVADLADPDANVILPPAIAQSLMTMGSELYVAPPIAPFQPLDMQHQEPGWFAASQRFQRDDEGNMRIDMLAAGPLSVFDAHSLYATVSASGAIWVPGRDHKDHEIAGPQAEKILSAVRRLQDEAAQGQTELSRQDGDVIIDALSPGSSPAQPSQPRVNGK